jgi:hypothetical protein
VTHFDAFNGDADGICALQQLRLANPKESILVTGVKRDIALLERVPAQAGDSVTALDISMAVNRTALVALLERDVRVEYFDHHYAGDVPVHRNLTAVLDPAPEACTGILVDRYLHGRYRAWAVVAAFGDNLIPEGQALAQNLGLAAPQVQELQLLGEVLTYNAYGDAEADLIVHPAVLYRVLHAYVDPLEFMRCEPLYRTLDTARRADLERARRIEPQARLQGAAIYVLPGEAWSRRVGGMLANELARDSPERAHAVLVPRNDHGYSVSVRAPLRTRTGADALCRKFSTGGSRATAAGINSLPADQLPELVRQMGLAFPGIR